MTNLVASFIGFQAFVTILYWLLWLKAGPYLMIFPLIWTAALLWILKETFTQKDIRIFIWWFSYLDQFLLVLSMGLIFAFTLFSRHPLGLLVVMGTTLALAFYFVERRPFLEPPSHGSRLPLFVFKAASLLPLLPLIPLMFFE